MKKKRIMHLTNVRIMENKRGDRAGIMCRLSLHAVDKITTDYWRPFFFFVRGLARRIAYSRSVC